MLMTFQRAYIVGLIACLGICFAPAEARASEREVELRFDRIAGSEICLDEAQLRGEVGARLGYDPFVAESPSRIFVTIAPTEGSDGFSAEIEFDKEGEADSGVRSFEVEDPSCGELAEAVVFAVSVAIDPGRALSPAPDPVDEAQPDLPAERAEPVVEPAPVESAVPDDADADTLTIEPEPHDSRSYSLHGVLGIGVTHGSAPATAGSFLAGLDVLWDQVSLAFRIRTELPRSAPYEGGRIETWSLLGEVSPCAQFGAYFACGTVAVGVQHATGVELLNSRSTTVPYAAVGGGVGARWYIGESTGLRFDGSVLAPVTKTTIRVGESAAWRASTVSAKGTISFFFRFL